MNGHKHSQDAVNTAMYLTGLDKIEGAEAGTSAALLLRLLKEVLAVVPAEYLSRVCVDCKGKRWVGGFHTVGVGQVGYKRRPCQRCEANEVRFMPIFHYDDEADEQVLL